MEWGAAQIALAIVGALFLSAVVAPAHPRLAVSLTTRVALSLAAGAYMAAAIGFGRSEPTSFEPVLWFVPVMVAVAVTRDLVGRHELRGLPVFPKHHRDLPFRNDARTAAVIHAPEDVDRSARAERAKDPATSSAELEELAYTLPEARSAVAAHPATPASVLSWLATHGDEAVIDAIALREDSAVSRAPER